MVRLQSLHSTRAECNYMNMGTKKRSPVKAKTIQRVAFPVKIVTTTTINNHRRFTSLYDSIGEERFADNFEDDDFFFFFFLVGLDGNGDDALLFSSSSSRGEGINESRIFGSGFTSINTDSVPLFKEEDADGSTGTNSFASEIGSSFETIRFDGFGSGIC